MKRERIIADVETVEDAKKVEETIKTGYIEPSIDTLVNWMGVEEDLASSYEQMASKQTSPSRKGTLMSLAEESHGNLAKIAELRKSLEAMDRERIERIKQIAGSS